LRGYLAGKISCYEHRRIVFEAEADIKKNAHVDALRKYETILYDEPHHAPTHNSLGWIYKTQFDDYNKAETHFKAAIKSDPAYPHPYFHYAVLLTDMDRYEELKKHLDKCLTISTVDKSWVYYRYAIAAELNMHFDDAINYFEKAILNSLNDEKIKEYQTDIERCKKNRNCHQSQRVAK
jgi:tetratricopeptide (TPR) repeat protein